MNTSINNFRQLLGGVACAVALSACTTAPVVAPLTMEEVMAKAVQASNANQKEAAMELWKQASVTAPADKEPWARMAQTKYDAGQYGAAIMDAQEVLLRDPSDTLANSIVAISGLRLSTRALADLSRQNNLSGSLRTESQDLAKLLRESLGESVLVPSVHVAKAPARAAKRKQASKSSKSSKSSKTNNDTSANPFDGLK